MHGGVTLNNMRQAAAFMRQAKHVSGGGHFAASPDLFFLLRGHGINPVFCAGYQAFSFLAKIVRRMPRAWPARSPCGSWVGHVRSWLHSLGWREPGAWVWNHPQLSAPQNQINLNLAKDAAGLELEAQSLRESRRHTLFLDFQHSGRRDASAVHGAPTQKLGSPPCARHIVVFVPMDAPCSSAP